MSKPRIRKATVQDGHQLLAFARRVAANEKDAKLCERLLRVKPEMIRGRLIDYAEALMTAAFYVTGDSHLDQKSAVAIASAVAKLADNQEAS